MHKGQPVAMRIHLPEKFNIPKYSQVIKFHVLNFCCFDYPRKFFNSKFLPIYGINFWYKVQLKDLFCLAFCLYHFALKIITTAIHRTRDMNNSNTVLLQNNLIAWPISALHSQFTVCATGEFQIPLHKNTNCSYSL